MTIEETVIPAGELLATETDWQLTVNDLNLGEVLLNWRGLVRGFAGSWIAAWIPIAGSIVGGAVVSLDSRFLADDKSEWVSEWRQFAIRLAGLATRP